MYLNVRPRFLLWLNKEIRKINFHHEHKHLFTKAFIYYSFSSLLLQLFISISDWIDSLFSFAVSFQFVNSQLSYRVEPWKQKNQMISQRSEINRTENKIWSWNFEKHTKESELFYINYISSMPLSLSNQSGKRNH